MKSEAKQLLQKMDVDKLPSLPHVLLRLLNASTRDNPSFDELAIIISEDPALYARVIAAYHQSHNNDATLPDIDTMLHALGINTIKSIATTASVQQFFSPGNPERNELLKQHWHHSLYCATVAQSLAKLSHYSNPEEAYAAGLLHDIGQLVLETAYPEKYTATFAELSEDSNFSDLEKEEFKTSHREVGVALLKKHGANSFLLDAIRYHHEDSEQVKDAHPLVRIVQLANRLSNRFFTDEDHKAFDAAEDLLGLYKPLILEMLEKSSQKVINIIQALELKLPQESMDGEALKQLQASDEFKQTLLAEQIRNIALLGSLNQQISQSPNRFDNISPLLQIISQQSGIMFGIRQCILFLADNKHQRLNAKAGDRQPPQLADISIPLKLGRSLVSDTLIEKQPLHSFDRSQKDLSIVDRQLLNLTAEDGIFCLPMIINGQAIGTLLFGVREAQYKNLYRQLPLLSRFANEVAQGLSARLQASCVSADTLEQNNQQEQLIREVLHEVRNPLSIMNNYLGILSYKLESDKTAQEDVNTIKSEIERISQILNRLTKTEPPTDETAPVDINVLISDLTRVFQSSLLADKNIEITLNLDEQISSLQSNANAIKQIYINLIKNAVEALSANGRIMVYTQDNVNVDGKQHIELVITDNGPGIDSEILPQLFSPVESTKGDDHAGLGLTIVKNLVIELHGSISCRSSDKGTSFHILLPK